MKFTITKLILFLLLSEVLICAHNNIRSDDIPVKKKTTRRKLIKKVHKFMKPDDEDNSKTENNNNISSWVFIPLTVLIFIMTIVSIIGFLVLILNSANSSPTEAAIKNNLTRSELNELLRIKQKIKSRMMSNSNAPPRLG